MSTLSVRGGLWAVGTVSPNVGFIHCEHTVCVRTCDYVPVQNATEWTAAVHTLHMSPCDYVRSQSAIRHAVLRYIHMSQPVITSGGGWVFSFVGRTV